MLKHILILSIIAVIMAAVIILVFYVFQKNMIFFPQKVAELNRKTFSSHEIKIEHDGVVLNGWFVKREISEEKPLLVYYGGNGEDVSGNLWELERFKSDSFLFMNYRGYGDSEGQPSEKNFFKDALFILDRVAEEENIALDNIVLMGRSLGSGVAVYAASQRKVRGIILVTPFDSLSAVAKHHYPWLPADRLLTHRFESIKRAPALRIPALFLMGDRDEIIPLSHSLKLRDKWGGPEKSVVIKGAAHNDISTYEEYWREINQFIGSLNVPLRRELENSGIRISR